MVVIDIEEMKKKVSKSPNYLMRLITSMEEFVPEASPNDLKKMRMVIEEVIDPVVEAYIYYIKCEGVERLVALRKRLI